MSNPRVRRKGASGGRSSGLTKEKEVKSLREHLAAYKLSVNLAISTANLYLPTHFKMLLTLLMGSDQTPHLQMKLQTELSNRSEISGTKP